MGMADFLEEAQLDGHPHFHASPSGPRSVMLLLFQPNHSQSQPTTLPLATVSLPQIKRL
jgi:hypothetical protein